MCSAVASRENHTFNCSGTTSSKRNATSPSFASRSLNEQSSLSQFITVVLSGPPRENKHSQIGKQPKYQAPSRSKVDNTLQIFPRRRTKMLCCV